MIATIELGRTAVCPETPEVSLAAQAAVYGMCSHRLGGGMCEDWDWVLE